MKKKRLSLLTVLAALAVTACGGGKTSSPVASISSNSITTSSNSTVNSTSSSNPVISSSSEVIDKLPDPDAGVVWVTNVGAEVETRVFDSRFDTMIDDFSANSPAGTLSGGALYSAKPYLRVRIDSTAAGFPNTPDASIYKQATGTYAINTYDEIVFRMRVTSGNINLENLVLGVRGGDDYEVYPIPLDTAFDADIELLPELSDEYQDFKISVLNSLETFDEVYKNKNGTDSSLKVIDTILGVHLYAKGDCAATLNIESVSLIKGGVVTYLDQFERENVGQADANCWWRGSTGSIITRHALLNNGDGYTAKDTAAPSDYEGAVISIKGISSGTSIIPVFKDGTTGAAVAWSQLKNFANEALPAIVNGAFFAYTINFVNSGINGEVVGLNIVSTSEVMVNKIFLTSLEIPAPAQDYPILGTSISEFDNFNGRTQNGFDADYDKSSNSEVIKDAGLYYMLSYGGNGDKASVKDGVLTFDATNLGDGYIDLKMASSRSRQNMKYLVLSVKLEGTASMDSFRIAPADGGEAKYAPNWFAGEGLKSLALGDADYPYNVADGFAWVIIDIGVTGMGTYFGAAGDTLNMYYNGTGKLHIDRIFFANLYLAPAQLIERVGDADNKVLDTIAYDYQYLGYATTEAKYLALTLKGDGVATLHSVRIGQEASGKTLWIKDGSYFTRGGAPLLGTTVIPQNEVTYYIDIEASGFDVVDSNYHGHFGGEGASGVITLVKVETYKDGLTSTAILDNKVVDFDSSEYIYVGGGNAYNAPIIAFNVKGDGVVTLASVRIEINGTMYWLTTAKDLTGVAVPVTEIVPSTDTTYYVNITSFGIANAGGFIHIHAGSVEATGTLTINSVNAVFVVPSYVLVISLIG